MSGIHRTSRDRIHFTTSHMTLTQVMEMKIFHLLLYLFHPRDCTATTAELRTASIGSYHVHRVCVTLPPIVQPSPRMNCRTADSTTTKLRTASIGIGMSQTIVYECPDYCASIPMMSCRVADSTTANLRTAGMSSDHAHRVWKENPHPIVPPSPNQ